MRRRSAVKRKINPDAKYHNLILAKLMNCLMERGKKSAAEKIVYGALDIIADKTKRDAIEVFNEALKNTRPALEVRSRRVGGATYQVPMEVGMTRGTALAIRWIIAGSRARGSGSMGQKLAAELMDAAQNRGAAVKKREDTHKMADANRAFAHFKW